MRLLRSLSKSYESLIVTLENMAKKLSIEEMHARFFHEESRKNSIPEENSFGNLLHSKLSSKNFGFPYKFHNCHKRGYKIADCQKRINDHRKSKKLVGRSTDTGTFLMAQGSDQKLSRTWYIDLGASFHMKNNIRWFDIDIIKNIEPISICLGDGTTILSK